MEFHKHARQRTNVQQIFQQIADNGPVSRRELQEMTGFSWGLISQVTNRLTVEGYIVGQEELTLVGCGRPAELLDVVPTNFYFIGVDIESDGMYAVVTDMKGRRVESRRYDWPRREYNCAMDTLYHVLDGLMEKYAGKNITSIGVAVQGVIDVQRGVSVGIGKIENWVDVPLRSLLSKRYGVDVVVAHDPDCLMQSECSFGALKNIKAENVLLMHYNHRVRAVGMSVLVGGQLYFGHRGRAAELGYTIVDETSDARPVLLGQYLQDPTVPPEKLCRSVGKAMAVANTLYNPEIIVLHIPDCPFAEEMARQIEHWVRIGSYDPTVMLKRSELDHDAKARGAAMIMVNRAIDEML